MHHDLPTNKPTGHMKPDSPSAEMWLSVYGSLEVPLESPLAFPMLNSKDEVDLFYKVDLTRLSDYQIEDICHHMAKIFERPVQEVRQGVRGNYGIPIRASELNSIIFDGRQFL